MAGLSNTHTHYITTSEEYQKQRYEAASTMPPYLLCSRTTRTSSRASNAALFSQEELPGGPPEDLLDYQISFDQEYCSIGTFGTSSGSVMEGPFHR